jgi:hypothetical protein
MPNILATTALTATAISATAPVGAARHAAMDRGPEAVDLAVARIADLRPARAAMDHVLMVIVAPDPQAEERRVVDLVAHVEIFAGMTAAVIVAATTVSRNPCPCRMSTSL